MHDSEASQTFEPGRVRPTVAQGCPPDAILRRSVGCFANNAQFCRETLDGRLTHRRRDFTPDMIDAAIRKHDALPDDAPGALKVVPGPTRVTLVDVDGPSGPLRVCVKEYFGEPLAGRLKHALLRALRRWPARQSFAAAHGLVTRGIGAPQPLAAVVPLNPLSARSSYFISAGLVGSLGADVYARDKLATPEGRRAFAGALGEFFRQIHRANVWHRDLKATNVRVTEAGEREWQFHVVDLDRVKFVRRLSEERRLKNLGQIAAGMVQQGAFTQDDVEALCRGCSGASAAPAEVHALAGRVTAAAGAGIGREPRACASRILHVLCDWKLTGPSEPTLNLCLALREAGHEVQLACQAAPDLDRPSLPKAAASAGLEPVTALRLKPSANPRSFWRDVKQLRSLVRGRGFDIVHVHDDHGMLMARLALGAKGKRQTKIVRSFHKAAAPGGCMVWLHAVCADGVVTVSQAQRERFLTRFSEPAVSQTFGATDLERCQPRPATDRGRELLGVAADDFVVGIVARVQRRRRFDLFLDAIKLALDRVPNLKAVVVGRGTHREDVVIKPALQMGLGDVVRFPGYLSGDDYLDALAVFDAKIFLVPGSDGSCRAARELMAMGKPVICTDRPPLPEIVEHESCGLVCSESAQALADAIVRLAQSPELVESMGRAARQRAETQFAAEREREAVESVYHGVLPAGRW